MKRTRQLLKEEFGRDYDYLISPTVGRKEEYAFLFNPEKVRVLENGALVDPDGTFFRDPYFASFRAGEFDFTVDRRACDLGRFDSQTAR